MTTIIPYSLRNRAAATQNGASPAGSMAGGTGDDTLQGGDGNDLLEGGAGRDTINGGGGDDLIFGHTQADPGGSTAPDLLSGDAGADTIIGAGGDDVIFGGAGNDSLAGGAGDDVIYGEGGADTMLGGAGNDQFVVTDALDVVIEAPGEGSADTVYVGVNGYVNGANIEIIRLYNLALGVFGGSSDEQIVANPGAGSILFGQGGDDVLWGSGFDDNLSGGSGSDTLRGGAGNDTMNGGDGVDIFVVQQLGDVLVETATGGYDTAYVTVNGYIMPESGGAFAAYVEVAYLAGTATVLNGSNSGENLVANPTAGSVLAGFGGNDILWGSDFGDSFTGGTQDDVIYSYGGADAIRFVESNWGWDQVSDFAPGAGDRLVFSVASGVTGFGQLNVSDNGVNTTVLFGGNEITLYGYVGLGVGDCQFIG